MSLYKIVKVGLVIGVAVIIGLGLGFSYHAIASRVLENATNYWCGLFVKVGTVPLPNLAVHLRDGYTYSTDENGYTGKIWSTGFSNGCPAGIEGLEIPATVIYHNTEYAIYLKAFENVTLTLM